MSHDVFISYSSKDKIIADAVCAKLEERKVRCWIAPRDISAGQNFAESIIDAIDNCSVFVLVWSANTNTSEHILNELNQAFDQGKPIIPFRIQEVEPTKAMRYYFGRTHWLDALTPPLEKHIRTLSDTILTFLASKSAAVPQAAPAEEKTESTAMAAKPSPQITVSETFETAKPVIPKPAPEKTREPKPERPKKEHQPKPERAKKNRRPLVLPRIERRVLVPILAGIGLLAVAAILYLTGTFKLLSDKIKANTPSEIPTITKTFTQNSPELTAPPTLTAATPTSQPKWIREFGDPILSAIKFTTPDFQDDFSSLKSDWLLEDRRNEAECSNTFSEVVNGKLHMQAEKNTGSGCSTWANLNSIDLNNVVIQYEMSFQNDQSNGSGTMLDLKNRDNISPSTTFTFSRDGSWYYDFCSGGSCNLEESGTTTIDPAKPVIVTLIIYDTWTAVYLNSLPFKYFDHSGLSLSNPSQFAFTVQSYGVNSKTVTFDNLKIWNLDKIGAYQNGAFTLYPAWLEPVLAAIQDRAPTFEDDFSARKTEWLLEGKSDNPNCKNTLTEMANGVIHMVADTNPGTGCWAWAHLPKIDLYGAVIQMDINLEKSYSKGDLILEDSAGHFITFSLSHNGAWNMGFCNNVNNNVECPITKDGFTSSYQGNPATILLISYGSSIAVWVDSRPLGILNSRPRELTLPAHLSMTVQNEDDPINIVEFDNIRIWDLTGIEGLPTQIP